MFYKLLVSIMILASSVFSATSIDSCVNISSSGVYELNANLSGNQSNGVCLYVNASDVVLDGKGFSIVGNSSEANVSDDVSTVGVFGDLSGLVNFTVRNLFVKNYSTDVRISGGTNVTVFNNTFSYGLNRTMLFGSVVNANVSGNTFFNTTHGDVVRLDYVNDSRFEDNEFNQGTGVLLYGYYPVNVTVFNNSFNDSGTLGVYTNYATNSSVDGNFFNNTDGYAAELEHGVLSNLSNNVVYGTSSTNSLIAFGGADNLIDNNTIHVSSYAINCYSLRTNVTNNHFYDIERQAIRVYNDGGEGNAENNTISGNVIEGVNDYAGIGVSGTIYGVHVFNNTFKDVGRVSWTTGTAITSSDGWIIENNSITWSAGAAYKYYGIAGGANNIIRNNHVYGGGKRGIYEVGHNNVTIENNLLEDCTQYGVFIKNANESIITGNNVTNASVGFGVFNLTNDSFDNNRITGSADGFLVNQSAFSNNFTGNYLSVSGTGIEVDYLSNNNLFSNNEINGAGTDVVLHDVSGNVFKNTILNNFNSSFSGTNFLLNPIPQPALSPTGFSSLQEYFNISLLSANGWAEVNTSYDESVLGFKGIENESSLAYLNYNSSSWTELGGIVNTSADYVSYNFSGSNFSAGLFGKIRAAIVVSAPGMNMKAVLLLFFIATIIFMAINNFSFASSK